MKHRPLRLSTSPVKGNAVGLLLVRSTSAAPSWRRFLLALRTWRDDVVGTGCRCCGATRHYPQLNAQVCAATTIHRHYPASIDTARIHQIVFRAIRSGLCLTSATAIGNDVALSTWLVLQLDSIVIKTSLLIVESDVPVLVKLRRPRRRCCHRSRARCCSRADWIKSTNFDRGRHRLTSQSGRIHRDG